MRRADRGRIGLRCCSDRSSTRTSAAPPTWSATSARASPRSSTRSGTSSPTCTSPACTGFESSTCSRPTTTPTTSRATAGSPARRGDDPHPPARRRRVPARGLRRRLGAAPRRGRDRGHAHRRPPARAHLVPAPRRRRGGEPVAVLTGDSLFVGDVARPDLAVEPEEGAARPLPLAARAAAQPAAGEVEVWPGHLGGSMCGSSGIDHRTSSTIGFERAHNHVARLRDRRRVRRRRDRLARRPARRTSSTSSRSTAARWSRSSARRRR